MVTWLATQAIEGRRDRFINKKKLGDPTKILHRTHEETHEGLLFSKTKQNSKTQAINIQRPTIT